MAGRIVCAPDSFKETLPACEAAAALAEGAGRADPGLRCDRCPVADGGEGSLDALMAALGGAMRRRTVTGPLGAPVTARLGLAADGDTAVVELAEASGLQLVPRRRRDPARCTTYGTGELIAAAAAAGRREVIVCLGGSATVDGGAGLAQALGVRFFDRGGALIEPPLTGARLAEAASVRRPRPAVRIRAACDVDNPLLGPRGAAAVYGPQKGASPPQVERLEAGLRRLAALGGADPDGPGSGAAGGAGYGLAAFCGARLEPGIDLVLEAVGFARRCRGADLVLTGEGCLDAQSLSGKACVGVARAAAALGVPAVAVAGDVRPDPRLTALFAQIVSLTARFGRRRALAEPRALLAEAAFDVLRRKPSQG